MQSWSLTPAFRGRVEGYARIRVQCPAPEDSGSARVMLLARSKSSYHQAAYKVALMFRAKRPPPVGYQPPSAQRRPRDETMLERTGSRRALDSVRGRNGPAGEPHRPGRIDLVVLLKYFQLNGRFPRHHRDVPGPVLAFLGEHLSASPAVWFGPRTVRLPVQVRHQDRVALLGSIPCCGGRQPGTSMPPDWHGLSG
jgi:hypothetical protein